MWPGGPPHDSSPTLLHGIQLRAVKELKKKRGQNAFMMAGGLSADAVTEASKERRAVKDAAIAKACQMNAYDRC